MKKVTMQHDLFVNPSHRARAIYPLVVVLQADVVEGDGRIVAPLTTTRIVPMPPRRVLPLVSHDGEDYVVMMRLLGYLSARHLGQSVGSIAQYRDDLTRALDWLFFGI
jgi:toxin CcdB